MTGAPDAVRPDDPRPIDDLLAAVRDPQAGNVAFTSRQVGGFVLVAALLLAVVRWLRSRGRS